MLIIGERINTISKSVLYAFQKRDSEYIRNEAIRQAEAGANIIDVNAGSPGDLEPHNMAWAVEIVQDAVDIPICIDSPNPKTLKAGFDVCRNKRNVWLNSITLERSRMEEILPLGREYNCPVIALCMDEKGIPQSVDDRVRVVERLIDMANNNGISLENLYVDPLIEPLSIHTNRGMFCLSTIKKIKAEFPNVKTVICLSAISFGLPKRKLINRAYLTLLMYEGIDAIILDPIDNKLMTNLRIANLLLDRDENCLGYLSAYREGRLEE